MVNAAPQVKDDKSDPDFVSDDARAMHRAAELPRSLMGGTPAMRDAGKAYLPKWTREEDEDYAERLKQAVLFNFFRRTVKTLAGRVFSKDVKIGEDVPPKVKAMLENVDLQGRNLTQFAREAFEEALSVGGCFLMVDAPSPAQLPGGEAPRDRRQEQAAALRPYIVLYKVEEYLGARTRFDPSRGGESVDMIRFKEVTQEPAGAYGDELVTRVRVLDGLTGLGYLKQKGADEKWFDMEGGPYALPLGKINVFPIYGDRTGFYKFAPPLSDLAYVNVTWWQSQSDQRSILHFARVPVWFAAGFSEGEKATPKILGPGVLVQSDNPGSTFNVVEHSGSAIGAGKADLEDLEARMAILGLEALLPRPGDVTATSHAINAAEAHSALKAMAKGLEDALNSAVACMAEMAGEKPAGTVEVNTDFGITAEDTQNLQLLVTLAMGNRLTTKRVWRELERRGVLGPDFNEEEEQTELDRAVKEMSDPAAVAALREAASGGRVGGNAGGSGAAAAGAAAGGR